MQQAAKGKGTLALMQEAAKEESSRMQEAAKEGEVLSTLEIMRQAAAAGP
jgi:hypothetical protein